MNDKDFENNDFYKIDIVDDLDFSFDNEDFKIDNDLEDVSVSSLVKKMKSKQKKFFNINDEVNQLEKLLKGLPKKDECYKMLSFNGGFSSIGCITYTAIKEPIEKLYISTFRIGKKQFDILLNLYKNNLIINNYSNNNYNNNISNNVILITSSTQKKVDGKVVYNDKEYNYYDYIKESCKENHWILKEHNNHSKLILMKTINDNYYVIETSSNLNENPKLEQFSWENDKELFEWYEKLFIELCKNL